MSAGRDEAYELISAVADECDLFRYRADQYAAGRSVILDYLRDHPKSVFAIGQAMKYLIARVELQPQEQL
jgi:hypothetical protein